MKLSGIKLTGFSRGQIRQAPEIEMSTGTETVTRRPTGYEFSWRAECDLGGIRLTLSEAEMRDLHMRLTRSLAMIDEGRTL